MELLNAYSDWLSNHTIIIIPGNFGGDGYTDLLFYDRDTGEASFYTTYLGHITLLKSYTDWRTTWDMIIPGNFSGGRYTDLLFYDRNAGEAEFYQTDGQGNITDGKGNYAPWRQYTDWRTTWTLIVPGHFAGQPNPNVVTDRELNAVQFLTDLLFYDSGAGVLEFYQSDGQGGITDGQGHYAPLHQYTGWGTTWTHIVPHYFGYDQYVRNGNQGYYTDLLFYDRQSGDAKFYLTNSPGNIQPYPDPQQPGSSHWSPGQDIILPGIFGNNADLLFYDAASMVVSFQLEFQGGLNALPVWPQNQAWSHIIPGAFGKSGFTDLLLYNKANGQAAFYRYQVPGPWPQQNLDGYVSATSVIAGNQLDLHFSNASGESAITIDISLKGKQDILVYQAQATAQLQATPDNAYEAGCGWPVTHSVVIPSNWESGLYVAHVSNTAGDIADVPFVVRASGTKAKILYEVAVATYQAYNWWGGRSLYGHGLESQMIFSSDPRAYRVSFDRPTYLNLDDMTKDEYSWYDFPFIQWLEQQGFQVDYCTSVDLDADPSLLDRYQLLLSVGHDEYWSRKMRENVENFIKKGGNVAFFSGNDCWWQVRFEDNGRTMVCYKNKLLDPLTATEPSLSTVNWYADPVNEPENTLTGVSYRYGGGWGQAFDAKPLVPYQVRQATHWMFQQTGLQDNGTFGTETGWSVVGGETDAAHYDPATMQLIGDDGTPANFEILATADLTGPGWENYWGGTPLATMGIFTNGGTVFTAATTHWSRGLSLDGGWTPVDQITWNVLNTMSVLNTIKVPNLVGQSPKDAEQIAHQAGFGMFIIRTMKGLDGPTVSSQQPAQGISALPGTIIDVVVVVPQGPLP